MIVYDPPDIYFYNALIYTKYDTTFFLLVVVKDNHSRSKSWHNMML